MRGAREGRVDAVVPHAEAVPRERPELNDEGADDIGVKRDGGSEPVESDDAFGFPKRARGWRLRVAATRQNLSTVTATPC